MKWWRNTAIILGVGLVLSLSFLVFRSLIGEGGYAAPDNLPPLPLEGHHKLLVLAPHCDDETLGAAGLIQSALGAGIQVQVVIATNGDGYIFATMEDFHRIYPNHNDFIRMGNLRQQESLSAMQTLGLDASQVIFLSYPDRGTPSLWNENWSRLNPFASPYSGADRSPYTLTYNPASLYDGEDYLADLESIFITYQPDLIIFPHPNDVHPDHWGLSAFTRLAVALVQKENPAFQPGLYTYLVHRPDYPQPAGLKPQEGLTPPPALSALQETWYRWDLSGAETVRKQEAVMQYKSQLPLLRKLLESFVRRNELFALSQTAVLPRAVSGEASRPNTWLDANGNAIKPVQLDPSGDFLTRSLVAAADLTAEFAAYAPDGNLWVCAEMREPAKTGLYYTLRLLAVGSQGVVHHFARDILPPEGWGKVQLNGPYTCTQISMASLGDPWLIFTGAEVEETGTGILDQIAWQQVMNEGVASSGK